MPSFYKPAGAVLGLLILAFEAWITAAGWFYPHVNKTYYDYFISHQSAFYIPPEMTAQAEKGLRGDDLVISKLNSLSADFLLATGWYPPEQAWVWSEGSKAVLKLPRDGTKSRLTIAMVGFAPRRPQQIKISVDHQYIEEATLHGGTNLLVLTVPQTPNDLILVSFVIEHPGSPASVGGSGDNRQLGIGLISLKWN